ncbi:MFS transporter [Amycolatopsis mediterranei]|uniref:MFS transporter n=1 Tax=Amycolatopsis mediterranei TaxID=33910 RepID=UPI00342EC316
MHRGSLFRHADFRRLWAGDTASQFGTFVGNTAIPLLAAVTLAATPFQMGLLTAAETAAFLLIGLPAGVWVDRLSRRRVMLTADFIRFALLLSVPISWWAEVLTLAQLLVVVLFVGIATVFFDIAYQSYLPSLVGREHLLEGNAKLQAVQSTAQIAGPSAAGVLVQLISAANTVLVTSLGFLTSALCLLRIRAVEPEPEHDRHTRLVPQMAEGLRFVFSDKPLRATVGTTGTANFFGGAFTAVYVLFLTRTVGLAPAAVGALLAVGGTGGILGAIFSGAITRRIGQARSIWLVPLCTLPGHLLIPLAAPDWRLVLAGFGAVVGWFGIIIYNVAAVSYRQAICPERLLGRMNASVRFVVWGTIPLGGLLGGALGEGLGLRGAMWVAVAGEVAAVLWVVCSPLRHLRDLPTEAKSDSAAA